LKSFSKWDKIILGSLLFICIISTIYIYAIENTSNNSEKVIIQVQGQIIKKIPLNKYEKSKIYKFIFNGNTGYVEIKGHARREVYLLF